MIVIVDPRASRRLSQGRRPCPVAAVLAPVMKTRVHISVRQEAGQRKVEPSLAGPCFEALLRASIATV
jgi:hypothetical protein